MNNKNLVRDIVALINDVDLRPTDRVRQIIEIIDHEVEPIAHAIERAAKTKRSERKKFVRLIDSLRAVGTDPFHARTVIGTVELENTPEAREKAVRAVLRKSLHTTLKAIEKTCCQKDVEKLTRSLREIYMEPVAVLGRQSAPPFVPVAKVA